MPACPPRARQALPSLLCLAAWLAAMPAAHAEEPLPLASVIERALAYDPQVRAAQAEVDALRRRTGDAGERDDRRGPAQRVRSDAPVSGTADAVAVDTAQRELRRLRERTAARAAAAALELQRQDRLVALARQRRADAEQLVRRSTDAPLPPRATAAQRNEAQAALRDAQAAQRAAEAALGDAQAARLMALAALEAQAGNLVQGVAAFEWPATEVPNPAGDEDVARQRAEELAARLREARARAAAADRRPLAQALKAREAQHGLELQAIDAAHAVGLARIGEQFRLGSWQRTLASAASSTATVAVVQAVPAADNAPAAAATAPAADAVPGGDPALAAALAGWLEAWRAKDRARYLASYAAEFTPAGMSRDQWRLQRTSRLAQPGRFEIEIVAPAWERTGPGTAELRFTQHYRSERYADVTNKSLVWRLGADGWRIVRETTEPARRIASSR